MSRSELPHKLAEEIRRRVFVEPGFMKITQVVRRGGGLFRVSLRTVTIRGEKCYQGEMIDEGRTQVKNFDAVGAVQGLEEMLGQIGPRELHLITAVGDLHVRVTRKGKVLEARSSKLARDYEEAPAHDRVKRQPLTSFEATPLLQALEIADADGRIKASMRGKYDQVNEFLRVIDATLKERPEGSFKIVDCGCGSAYLTLAVYCYLTQVRGFDVQVCGIERNKALVDKARQLARMLDVGERVTFIKGDIATVEPPFTPEMTLSLHACDTATDEALARGIEWKSRYLLCVPCCQHELHKSIKGGGAMGALLRHGILRERLADLLTDTFRVQILRILGFKVQVMEFVSVEATARNLLLKGEFAVKPGQQAAISEYLELRDLWGVTPWLEGRMLGLLEKYLQKFDSGAK